MHAKQNAKQNKGFQNANSNFMYYGFCYIWYALNHRSEPALKDTTILILVTIVIWLVICPLITYYI